MAQQTIAAETTVETVEEVLDPQEQQAKALRHLADLVLEQIELEEKIEAARAHVEELTREHGPYDDDLGSTKIVPSARFDKYGAMSEMSERTYKRVQRPDVDPKLVKKMFPGIYRRNLVHSDTLRVNWK